jgi:DNA-binding SARP family transcriptional activator/TolB-like protein/cytochrome c-type biogenesis protein CcmH/NrfG
LLGRFAAVIDGDAPSELRIASRKGRALLAYLAMHPDHQASREHLAALLWGDQTDERARHSLRQCLVSLRRDLAKGTPDVLAMDASTVSLKTNDLRIDAVEFSSLADSPKASDIERAAALYRGEFLSEINLGEPFDTWVRRTRGHLDDVAARVLETCLELADARCDGKQALWAAERLIAFDAFREDWQRLALRVYARYRGREFALAHADACVALLKSELGVDPEPATHALIDDIRKGSLSVDPSACPEFPPERVADATFHVGKESSRRPGAIAASTIGTRKSGVLAAFLPGSSKRAIPRSLSVVFLSAVCVLAFVVAFPWISTWLDAPSASSPATSDRVIPHGGAMVENRAIVPIVVLPFSTDAGADAADRKIAGLLTENVTETLTRFAGLGVVSRQTALTYMGRSTDASVIGNELGVRYVVEASIKSDASRLTIGVQLVDTADRLQVWSDRFERDEAERSAVQDEIASRIARGLQIAVTFAEASRATDERTREPAVGELLIRGMAVHFGGPSRKNVAAELALFEEALRREPDLPPAMLGVGMALTEAATNSLADDPGRSLDRAEEQLDRVLEKEPTSYRAYYWKAMVAKARGRYTEAFDLLSKSIEFNQGLALSFAQLGDILTRLGRPAEGLDHVLYAIRVSPKDTAVAFFYLFAGTAELELHHEQAAIDWFRRASAVQPGNPTPYKFLAAAYALTGNKAEATKSWDLFRSLSVPPALGQLADKLQREASSGSRPPASRLREGLKLVLTL